MEVLTTEVLGTIGCSILAAEIAPRRRSQDDPLRRGDRAPEKIEHAAIHQQKGAADHECSEDLLQ